MSCIRNDLFRLHTKELRRRNLSITEWGLVAKKDIPSGTFLGFYTGDFRNDERESLYSAKVDNVYIYPFSNESAISLSERERHPFASMNEPQTGTHANCCMIIQDFDCNEVTQVDPNARFYRGLACFTCTDVKESDELTWHYGKAYEENRKLQGYSAGWPCEKLLRKLVFIPSNSASVLTYMPKVSIDCVFPVYGTHKSERFKKERKKKRKRDSDDDSDTSSSGSGHIPKYQPSNSIESREDRIHRRNAKVT